MGDGGSGGGRGPPASAIGRARQLRRTRGRALCPPGPVQSAARWEREAVGETKEHLRVVMLSSRGGEERGEVECAILFGHPPHSLFLSARCARVPRPPWRRQAGPAPPATRCVARPPTRPPSAHGRGPPSLRAIHRPPPPPVPPQPDADDPPPPPSSCRAAATAANHAAAIGGDGSAGPSDDAAAPPPRRRSQPVLTVPPSFDVVGERVNGRGGVRVKRERGKRGREA